MNRIVLFVIASMLAVAGVASVRAQDEARAVWQVTNFDVTVNNPGANRALNTRAAVSVRNVGKGSGATLSLRINAKAEIKTITIGGANASYRSLPESRGGVQRLTITLPKAYGPNETLVATVEYNLPVADNTGLSALSPVGSQFLPLSSWYPTTNTQYAVRGPDYAPFRVTVNGATAISSGIDKSAGGNSIFEQALNGQPFFVTGNWDRIDGAGNAKGISAYLPKGASADEQKQAQTLVDLAGNARAFYVAMFGAAPEVPVRLVAVTRGAGFDDAGTILLSDGALHRKKVDSVTALGISEAIAHLWVGTDTPVHGEGYGVIREGLSRFLALLFIEKEFGLEAADSERARQRLAYTAVAKRDVPLSRTTPIDSTFFSSVSNKGAMVWRLIDHSVGRDVFVATLRGLLSSGKTDPDGLSLARVRASFVERGGAGLKAIIDQEFDQPTDMDLMAGLPHQEGGQWVAALRNLGSFDVTVNVKGSSGSGQDSTVQGTIPAHDFGQVNFKGGTQITRVEIDPEKFYPQIDYDNDVAPRGPSVGTSMVEATRLFGAQDYAKAEALARQLLANQPQLQEARIVLARTLLAENKNDEAEREFKRLGDDKLPLPAALAWSSIGLGDIALRRGQTAEASRNFTDAVLADAEYASTLAARAGRVRAEGTAAPVDESTKSFINQLDGAIRGGRRAEIEPLVVPGELVRFVQDLVGTQPETWQTRILRSEQLDSNRMALDVSINTRRLGVDHSGTAVFVLAKLGGSWKLNAIDFFEVR